MSRPIRTLFIGRNVISKLTAAPGIIVSTIKKPIVNTNNNYANNVIVPFLVYIQIVHPGSQLHPEVCAGITLES